MWHLSSFTTSVSRTPIFRQIGVGFLLCPTLMVNGAAPDNTDAPDTIPFVANITAPRAVEIVSLKADMDRIFCGQSVTITAEFKGGTASLNPGNITFTSGVGIRVKPTETTTYTLTVTDGSKSVTQDLVVRVDTKPSQITSFNASSAVVNQGDKVTLSWALDGGAPQMLTLNNASVIGKTSLDVIPNGRQRYSLKVFNPFGRQAKTVDVVAKGISTFAGKPDLFGNVDGPAASARFGSLYGIARSADGKIFCVDTYTGSIRSLSSDGKTVSTLSANAAAVSPWGLVSDAAGTLYVNDYCGIRMIDASGKSTLIAGLDKPSDTEKPASVDKPIGTDARFTALRGLVYDDKSNSLYAIDGTMIRQINLKEDPATHKCNYAVTTFAGSATKGSADSQDSDPDGTKAQFTRPYCITAAKDGSLYVTDSSTLRKINLSNGHVLTVAGVQDKDHMDTVDGIGKDAKLYSTHGIAASDTFVYFTEYTKNAGEVLRSMDLSTCKVTTIAGSATAVRGFRDGKGAYVRMTAPLGIVFDGLTSLFFTDGYALRKYDIEKNMVSTVAGPSNTTGTGDCVGIAASFNGPQGICRDFDGTMYVADRNNHTIRRINKVGEVTTFAGKAELPGIEFGTGIMASFTSPSGVATDFYGNVYVAEYGSNLIRKITPNGAVSLLAGSTKYESVDEVGIKASFKGPWAVATDYQGNVYVSDKDSFVIRKIDPTAKVTTLAGTPGKAGSDDGVGATASFGQTSTANLTLSSDFLGTLYVGDGPLLRTVDMASGKVTTLLKCKEEGVVIRQLDVADNGDVYFTAGSFVRKATKDASGAWTYVDVAGTVDKYGYGSGVLPGTMQSPTGITHTDEGDLIVVDGHGLVRITAP